MQPLVSILIPVYNTEEFLPKCLDSIVNQTYPNLQVVIIDDGSKDKSLCIAQKYAKQYPYIEVYHQKNQGVASTRNNLLDKVKGDYVLFVDSDDWCELDMINYLLDKAVEYKADMVTCSSVIDDASIKEKHFVIDLWEQERVVKEFLRHVFFRGSLWNKLLKSDLLYNLKFDDRISYGEDALFIWNVIQKVNRVLITDKELYHYRMNEASISHQDWNPKIKGSGHEVWKYIVSDTRKKWFQYLEIAKARFAIEDMLLLYSAAICGYRFDENIRELQLNIKGNFFSIFNTNLVGIKGIILSFMLSYYYRLSIFLLKMFNIVRNKQ